MLSEYLIMYFYKRKTFLRINEFSRYAQSQIYKITLGFDLYFIFNNRL